MGEPAYKTEVVTDEETGKEIEIATLGTSFKDHGVKKPKSPQIATEKEPSAVQRSDPFSISNLEKISDPNRLPPSVPKPAIKEKDPKSVVFDPDTGAVKHDGLKPRVDLIPPEVIFAMGAMFRHGAEKYEDRNWEKGMRWSRVFGSTMRHLWAWWAGEDIDPESKQPHLYSAACCVAMLIAYRERKVGTDDRYFKSTAIESNDETRKDGESNGNNN